MHESLHSGVLESYSKGVIVILYMTICSDHFNANEHCTFKINFSLCSVVVFILMVEKDSNPVS